MTPTDKTKKNKAPKQKTAGKENGAKNSSSSSSGMFGSLFGKTGAKESKSAKIAQLNKENAMLKQHNQELDAKLHYLKSQVADVINSA